MAKIAPFKALRPAPGLEEKVAARPYDVLNSAEARVEAAGNPHSFLRVTKPEIDLPEDIDQYAEEVYEKGRENLDNFVDSSTLIEEDVPCLYLYRQIMPAGMIGNTKDLSQIGIVTCSSIDDYFNDVIKKHEFTRPKKENDRIKHMATLGAHVGPVFLTYPEVDAIDELVFKHIDQHQPIYDFTTEDTIKHTIWVIDDVDTIATIVELFDSKVPATYIADGHHRAASSAKVGQRLREQDGDYTGLEEYNHFLSVLFPANQLTIIDYNRVVKDLNGLSTNEFMDKIAENFLLEASENAVKPTKLHEFGLYIDQQWYKLTAKENILNDNDPIGVLDVTVLTENVLAPILNIVDQRTDERIDFVGGIRGMKELEKRVDSGEMKLAISLYPVSIQQLINIADSGNVMPPKSTWFEPKLRSGLLAHRF